MTDATRNRAPGFTGEALSAGSHESDLRDYRLQALKLATSANTTSDKSDGSTTLARAKLFLDFMLGTSTDTKAG